MRFLFLFLLSCMMPGDERSLLQSFQYCRMSKVYMSTLSEKHFFKLSNSRPRALMHPQSPRALQGAAVCGLPCTCKCLQLVTAPVKGWLLVTKVHNHFILLVCCNANRRTEFARAKSPDSFPQNSEFLELFQVMPK